MNEKEREKFEKMAKDYRQAILLASAGAFLHNLGKVSKEFNLHQAQILEDESEDNPQLKPVKKFYYYQQIIGLLRKDAATNGFSLDVLSPKQFGGEHDISERIFSEQTRGILEGSLGMLMKPFNDRDYRLGDFIEYLGQGSRTWAKMYYASTTRDAGDTEGELRNSPSTKLNVELLRKGTSLLTHIMDRCHDGASGGEKHQFLCCKQIKDGTRPVNRITVFESTPFGFETVNATNGFSEYCTYREGSELILQDWQAKGFLKSPRLDEIFKKVMADNRRPFNNISVYDIGHSGMALLKSIIWTLADSCLSHSDLWLRKDELLRWRILGLRLDGLEYLSQAVSIGDFRVRKRKLDQFLDLACRLLEEEYPVATEVYRDENGSIFVFPDWDQDSPQYQVLREKYQSTSTTEWTKGIKDHGLILPNIFGLRPRMMVLDGTYAAHPGLGNFIGRPIKDWIVAPPEIAEPVMPENLGDSKADICPYCSLRLVGTGAELYKQADQATDRNRQARERKSCAVCMIERTGPAREWWEEARNSTIWMGEVADQKGRLALITGRFYPEKFLELDYLPEIPPNKGKNQKTDSEKMLRADAFARSRRVWECCRDFWNEIEKELKSDSMSKGGILPRKRAIIAGQFDGKGSKKLSKYHAYKLEKDGISVSVFYIGNEFVTIENFDSIEGTILNQGKQLADHFGPDSIWKVIIPGGYGKSSESVGNFIVQSFNYHQDKYWLVLGIVKEPRTFMMLVPAANAMDVIELIKYKYDSEMGKVRSRMPLTLGVVFAGVYTPLRVLMDAGRRMLQREPVLEEWMVKESKKDSVIQREDGSRHPVGGGASAVVKPGASPWLGKWATIQMTVPNRSRAVTWKVCLTCGGTSEDNCVDDKWYPFVPVAELPEDDPNRILLLQPRPDGLPVKYMMHAKKLHVNDKVQVYPSTFDFEFLDGGGARFEIAYEGRKRRSGTGKSYRPYLLEDLKTLAEIKRVLQGGSLKRSQIHSLCGAIAARREQWGGELTKTQEDEVFWQFCRDLLVNARWNQVRGEYPWKQAKFGQFFDDWATFAALGWFEDAVELYL